MFSIPIRSRCTNEEGSSTAQNQKLRLRTSAGVSSISGVQVPYMSSVGEHVVEPVEQAGDPADATLGHADPDPREANRYQRVQPVHRREHRVAEEQDPHGVGGSVGGGCGRGPRGADVEVDHGVGLLARGHDRIPVTGMDGRQPQLLGGFGEGDGLEAALGVAAYLGGTEVGIEQPRDLAGNDPLRMRPSPRLDVPVVEGSY